MCLDLERQRVLFYQLNCETLAWPPGSRLKSRAQMKCRWFGPICFLALRLRPGQGIWCRILSWKPSFKSHRVRTLLVQGAEELLGSHPRKVPELREGPLWCVLRASEVQGV